LNHVKQKLYIMKNFTRVLSLMCAVVFSWSMTAQSAQVQIIHNSPDPAANSVDIYVNGNVAIPGLEFRNATPFLTLNAGVDLAIAIAPANTSLAAAVFSTNLNLTANENYIVVANGVVVPANFDVAAPFGLTIYTGARTQSTSPTAVDVLIHHGSPDAPAVSAFETSVPAGQVVNNLAYTEFTNYLPFVPMDYVIDLTTADGSTIVATYEVPLAGTAGSALTVIASGFLDSDLNPGPDFGLFVAMASGGPLMALPLVEEPGLAEVQIIHNSADLAAASVDIYINGEIAIPAFAFRTATPFLTLPSGVDLEVDVVPAGQALTSSVFNATLNLEADKKYVVIASGIVSDAGYAPATPFGLSIFDLAQTEAEDENDVDLLLFHGATDAPAVDVVAVGIGTVSPGFEYGDFDGYLSVPTDNYTFSIVPTGSQTPVASYSAPLEMLNLGGTALTVVASGFLNPAANSNGPAFGLWVASADGGPLLELPNATANIQVIHNSADAAAAIVDVYLNGEITVPNFAFRTATPFVPVNAEMPLTIDVVPAGQPLTASVFNVTTTLADYTNYVIVANGIVSQTGFVPAEPFGLFIYDRGRIESEDMDQTDVLVFHGATDAPMVDVYAVNIATLVDDLSYGEFIEDYLELPTADYLLNLATADGQTIVNTYSAPLQTLNLGGEAITIVASGFLNPAANSNGPAFGLWVATSTGGALTELPVVALSTPDFNRNQVKVYPNPANDIVRWSGNWALESTTMNLIDMNGRVLKSASQTNQLEVNGINSGLYLIQITNGAETITEKLVIE
jgi:hypothetical protein